MKGGARKGAGRPPGAVNRKRIILEAMSANGITEEEFWSSVVNDAMNGGLSMKTLLVNKLYPTPKPSDDNLELSLTADDLISPEVFLQKLAECVLDGEISPERAKTLAELVSVCKDWKLISEALNEG